MTSMKKTSASTPIPFLQSLKQNSVSECAASESDYLLAEVPQDRTRSAAQGIATLFKLFPYELHTFQFIKTDSTKTHSPVKTFTDPKEALKTALSFSNDGYDVFFMVNEGDGIVHEGKRVCRSQASVKYLSRCFIDTDNCPVEKVSAYLELINLVPHLIVESSPGRYHFYFFFEPVEKTDDNIATWKAIQQILHRLGDPSIHSPSKTLGTDATMHDYSKVLRVPGFVHIKKLSLTKITTQNDIPDYTLEELFNLTNANSFLTYHNGHAATIDNVPDLNDSKIYEAGERYQALQSLTMSLSNDDSTPQEDHYITFHTFVITRLDNSDNVYLNPDKTLTPKSLDLFNSAFKKRAREIRSEKIVITETLAKIDEPKPSPWELPDSFYLSAPNGFGDVVRQVMDYSMYPCASIAFGTFLTGLSILKAKTHFTPLYSSPALYVLNVAISGYGKNDPMTLLQNLFHSIGLGKLTAREMRSHRGIFEHLYDNDSMGLFIIDEIATTLRSIQSKDAAAHLAGIDKVLLEYYSAGAQKGLALGKLSGDRKKDKPDEKSKEIILNNPMLAILGFTTPLQFQSSFNIDSVTRGLFQRFIPIVADIKRVPESPNADKTALIKSDLFTLPIQATELDKDGNQVEPLQAVERKRIRYTEAAARHYQVIKDSYRDEYIQAAKHSDGMDISGVYSRVAEQIERIATTLAQDEIDLTTLEYAATFMNSRHRATIATLGDTIMSGRGKDALAKEEALLGGLVHLCKTTEKPQVLKSVLYRHVRRKFDYDIRAFDTALEQSHAAGKIVIQRGKKGADLVSFGDLLSE